MNRLKQRLSRIEQRDIPEAETIIQISVPADHETPVVDNKVWFLSECGKFKYTLIKCASRPAGTSQSTRTT
jgi:hypothetical protein